MFLGQYLSSVNNEELVRTISATSASFIQKINENLTNSKQVNALLLGNVQSGKTAQMLGVIAAMADNGYKFFLLLTTDNVDLYRQTYNRVKESLIGFNVLTEKEDPLLTPATLIKPTVVVLKKTQESYLDGRIIYSVQIYVEACFSLFLMMRQMHPVLTLWLIKTKLARSIKDLLRLEHLLLIRYM